MTNTLIYHHLNQLIHNLRWQMQRLDYWSEDVPTTVALASAAPFACDTLAFEQWLQFIFIPKMQLIIDESMPLPASIALLPMAEMRFATNVECRELLSIFADIDTTINEHSALC